MQCASDYKIWLSQWVYRKSNSGGSYCLLLLLPHQVKQEIRSSSSCVFVAKMNYLEKTSGLKPDCLRKPCTTLGVFTDEHLCRSWKALRHDESHFLWNWHAQGQSAFGLGCSCYREKATSCGNGFVKCCMPVKAASHRVLTLVLTLQGIFKENRIELGVCFRLHNMVVGYHMQKNQQGIYWLLPKPAVPWLRALRGTTLDTQQLLLFSCTSLTGERLTLHVNGISWESLHFTC